MTDIGNDTSTAAPIAIDGVVRSDLGYSGDVDVFRIEITHTDRYVFGLNGAGSGIGMTLDGGYLTLTGQGGESYPGQSSPGMFGIEAVLKPGVYFLTVGGFNPVSGSPTMGTYQLHFTQPNQTPVAFGEQLTGAEADTPFVVSAATLLANDHDPNPADTLVVEGVVPRSMGGSAGGQAALVDGRIVFTPDPGHLGPAFFDYYVSDGRGGVARARAEFTVAPASAPTAAADTAEGTENQALAIDVLANDKGGPLTLTGASAPTGKGAASVIDGKLAFDPGRAFDHLAAGQTEVVTLTYGVRNAAGREAAGLVTVTITGTNDAPVAVADTAAAVEDSSVSGDVLANDSDVDAATVLKVSGVSFAGVAGAVGSPLAGAYGTLILRADGSWSYAADADLLDTLEDASGLVEVFTYTVSDGQGGVSTATLEIAVALADDKRTIYGGNGPDRLSGDRDSAGAEDTILGDTGSDWLSGEAGADTLFGGSGDDFLEGGSGRDTLHGERGADVLDGGAGDDRLLGGHGDDRLTGGAGADRFVFGPSGGVDTVTDFERGVDRIVLDGVAVTSFSQADLDGDGVLDAVLELSQGAVVLMGVGAVADWAGLVG